MNKKHIGILLLIYSGTCIYEGIGVHTGIPFGSYHYLDGLGTKIFGVPLLIGVNWLILSLSTYSFFQSHSHSFFKIIPSNFLKIIIPPLLMVLLDLLIEPIAPQLQYWEFESGIAPIENYLGWLLGAFIIHYFIHKIKLPVNLDVAQFVFISQIFFFTTLNVLL